jgi:hypothetical protein
MQSSKHSYQQNLALNHCLAAYDHVEQFLHMALGKTPLECGRGIREFFFAVTYYSAQTDLTCCERKKSIVFFG